MRNAEKQILDLLPELDQTRLKKVLEIVFFKLKANEPDQFGVTFLEWLNMEESIKQYEKGELKTISREEMERQVKLKKGKSL